MLEHANEEVAERCVVFEVFEDVTLVLVAAAGEDDREVLAGVSGGVAEVADVEDGGAIEEAAVAFLGLLRAYNERDAL